MYAIVHGTGAVIVDGQEVPVRPGQFIAVTPDSVRHVRATDGGLVFIAVCAAPTSCRIGRPALAELTVVANAQIRWF